MRRIALAGAGLAVAAAFAPLPSASASCHADLSAIGGPSCANLCPGILIDLTDRVSPGFLSCTL